MSGPAAFLLWRLFLRLLALLYELLAHIFP